MAGYNIHGERVVDGDASTLTVLNLYEAGSASVARTLGSTEVLHITDVLILVETAGDVALVADSLAAGKYIVFTKAASGGPIHIHFATPFICPKGVVPKFAGVSSNRNQCMIQGFIREA